MSDTTTLDVLKKPEIKAVVTLMKDPVPSHVLANYVRSKVMTGLKKEANILERPVDIFKDLAVESVGGLGGLLGAKAASGIAKGLGPRGQALATLGGIILGRGLAMEGARRLADKALEVAEEAEVVPELLTGGTPSREQVNGAIYGNLIGQASVVPVMAVGLMKGQGLLPSTLKGLGTSYVASRLGQGIGNMVGSYISQQATSETDTL